VVCWVTSTSCDATSSSGVGTPALYRDWRVNNSNFPSGVSTGLVSKSSTLSSSSSTLQSHGELPPSAVKNRNFAGSVRVAGMNVGTISRSTPSVGLPSPLVSTSAGKFGPSIRFGCAG
jgi:hypothetical protein